MSNSLEVTVKQKTNSAGQNWVEGTYQLPSSTVTKLSLKDGSVQFPNVATLKNTARRLATALGREVSFVEPTKKAAKKSVTKNKTTKNKTKNTTTSSTSADSTTSS